MEERMRFVMAIVENQESVAAVCRRFGVSRKTGYKWLERYEQEGAAALADRSRAPLTHPHALTKRVAARCIEVRRAHPTWGPVKVRAYLNGGRRAHSGRRRARSGRCSIARA